MEICGQRYAHNGYATLPDTNSQFMGFQDIKTLILVLKEIINSFFAKELSQSRTFQKSTLHLRTFCSGVFFKTVQRIYARLCIHIHRCSEELHRCHFFGGFGGSSSSSKGFFPRASRSALTSSISSFA